jgi:hypothetical protein
MCISCERYHFEGAYNQERKLNLLMAVSANQNYDMEWHKLWPQEEGGTNLFRMYTFIVSIINQLAINWPGRTLCFTMDNLNIHHTVLLHMIASLGHRYLFRVPYWSIDGPMEYVFNTILFCCSTLVPLTKIDNLDILGNHVDTVIAQLTNFKNYFLHVKLPKN